MIRVYTISYPDSIENEEFAGLFFEVESEGVEEKETCVEVYLSEQQQAAGEQFIQAICDTYQVDFTQSILENKNWNAQWESSFQPILIEDFVFVRTTFHEPNQNVAHEIIIEPKMSFGTGHHPTTSQMMQNMRLIDFKEKSVLDCGSGTGILAILAAKLGATNCLALDNDEWCYQNCIENIELNKVENITPIIGEIAQINQQKFDVILANIHRNFLTAYMSDLSLLLKDDGYVIVSGFYEEDAKIILDNAAMHHLIANYHTTQNNWTCIVLQKKN